MIRLPIHFDPQRKRIPRHGGVFRVALTFALLCLVLSSVSLAQDRKSETPKPEKPDVLVAVLTGVGPQDNVAMDYSSEASPKTVQKDLINLQSLTGWQISDAQASIEPPGPDGKSSTGASFTAPGIVDGTQGALPLEPFIVVLKRFHRIEIDYIVGPEFTYQGLKDFENDYVKIKLRQSGTTYRFVVTVKNNDFTKLDLPVTQVEQEQRSAKAGYLNKTVIAVAVALLAAVIVFLVLYFVGRNRRVG